MGNGGGGEKKFLKVAGRESLSEVKLGGLCRSFFADSYQGHLCIFGTLPYVENVLRYLLKMIACLAVNVYGRIMHAVLVINFLSNHSNWYEFAERKNLLKICWMKICFMHWGCTYYFDSSSCSEQIECLWDNEMHACTFSIF